MGRGDSEDRSAEMEGLYAGYAVYDMHYEKIGEVDDLFVDEDDRPEYVGVKMGFLGLRSTLVPWGLVRVNEKRGLMEVSEAKDRVKDAPTFDSDEEITPEFEERVYRHFGLHREDGFERSAYGSYYRTEDPPSTPRTPDDPGRGREAGRPHVRKRERTGRDTGLGSERSGVLEERGEAGTARGEGVSGDREEIVVPVMEERIVIRKRPVIKERIVIRKRVVEDEEIVEVPVRKEEADIIDETGGETTRRDV
jgi:uncharacterized protein (TIGR02271 family)